MNLQNIARGYVGTVNPNLPVVIAPNRGYVTLGDGTRVPSYATPVSGWTAQIQSMTYQDLRQVDGLNLTGIRRSIYLNGRWPGVSRPFTAGGDLITFPQGTVYLSAMLLEDWNDTSGWCKVAATLQNVSPPGASPGSDDPPEQYYEVGTAPFFRLQNGYRYGQRALIVDNLLRASPENPIYVYGNFNSGQYFVLNTPGEAIEPFWDDNVWVLA